MNIQEKTEKKVFSFMEEQNMITPGESVVVGVSGGADSVCLLFLLSEYQKVLDFHLQAVHIHHGIREDAEKDAEFVGQLCEKLGIPFCCKHLDVPKLAAMKKISTEAAGREARYESFYQIAEAQKATKIAVAHNKNDNAETVLFHLFRGSGISGLAGISPVRKGEGETFIIRPVLCLEREEIESYLRERGIAWCEDSTNAEDDYTRNRIRHHILPYVEENIVQGAVEHISNSAQMLKEAEDYLAEQTKDALEKVSAEKGRLDCDCLRRFPQIIQQRVLFAMAKEVSPSGKDITLTHVKDMMGLLEKKENRSIHLPYGIVVSRSYGELVFERKEPEEKEALPLMQTLQINHRQGHLPVPALGMLEYRKFGKAETVEIPKNLYTKWFDCDKIEQSIQVRFRQEGDYLCIRDAKGQMRHKTLKQYMIDEKIPKQERDKLPVLADGQHILWVPGYRISEFFKVTENTKTIIEVKLIRSDCKSQ